MDIRVFILTYKNLNNKILTDKPQILGVTLSLAADIAV